MQVEGVRFRGPWAIASPRSLDQPCSPKGGMLTSHVGIVGNHDDQQIEIGRQSTPLLRVEPLIPAVRQRDPRPVAGVDRAYASGAW
jgi:hypothetical protein